MKWRSWILPLHRDLGYFFTGVTLIYAISGIAVNHVDDWNPHFIIDRRDVALDLPHESSNINTNNVVAGLSQIGEADSYRSFDVVSPTRIKIYLENGDILVNLTDGRARCEKVRRRPLLHEANLLHLNPKKWWKVFADLFAVGLILIALTGLCVGKGPQGLLGRGKWLVGLGLLFPLAAMLALQ